jgi:23S rRNA (uracil1939-C5)-methyltransferase
MKKDELVTLEIHGLGSAGEGVGHHENYAVFVDGALPGEAVVAQMTDVRKRHGFAKLLEIQRPSPDRTSPLCPLFGKCGGCQLMHLAYPKQLEMKRQRVADAMQRIGKIDCVVEPCLPSPSPLAYRNKIQLPVQKGETGLSFGLYARASHDLVVVDSCSIHSELGEEVYRCVRKILQDANVSLRHLLIKSAVKTNEALVILVTDESPAPHLTEQAKKIMASHPSIKGVVHNRHSGGDNVVLGASYQTLAGKSVIRERLGDLEFQISAASFFQVNPAQAERLYEKALEFAGLTGTETVLDAFCGVGTLTLTFAKKAKKAIGVDCVLQAIENARENALLNGIRNAEFIAAAAEDFIRKIPRADVVLLNPPRKGCEPALLAALGPLSPKKIIYISCDPATLARDLARLEKLGYKADAIQPFDMFPQTSHVECVVKLQEPIRKVE